MHKMTMRVTAKGRIAFIDAELGPEGNTSGLRPYGRNIIVKMDEVAENSAVGLVYPDEVKDFLNQGSASGCIIALGSEAFQRHENGHTWAGSRPTVGDRVEVVQYSGKIAGGADGAVYRVMDQNCVIAGIDFAEPSIGDVQ